MNVLEHAATVRGRAPVTEHKKPWRRAVASR